MTVRSSLCTFLFVQAVFGEWLLWDLSERKTVDHCWSLILDTTQLEMYEMCMSTTWQIHEEGNKMKKDFRVHLWVSVRLKSDYTELCFFGCIVGPGHTASTFYYYYFIFVQVLYFYWLHVSMLYAFYHYYKDWQGPIACIQLPFWGQCWPPNNQHIIVNEFRNIRNSTTWATVKLGNLAAFSYISMLARHSPF